MSFEPENGIAYIIKMRHRGVIQQQRIFDFACVADDTMVANNNLLSNVGVVTDLAVAANDCRPFDHRTVLDHSSLADKDPFPNEGDAFAVVVKPGAQCGAQVFLELWQSIPSVPAVFKNRSVLCLG